MTITRYKKRVILCRFFPVIDQNKRITKFIYVTYELCFFNALYDQNVTFSSTHLASSSAVNFMEDMTADLS